ncbi:MAG: hypothetical protein P8Z71_06890 [Candidatus Sulfobium sp.]|jgi:hypothetical protein
MREVKDMLWTWLLPDAEREINRGEWVRHGGKWIIFDSKERLTGLAEKMGPLIDSGEIESAKYWNKDPSAICVYSLDRDKDKTWDILKKLGAGNSKVWEYDYAWDKNIQNPVNFMYSWFSKFRTILQSYGLVGTLELIREILKPKQ